MTGGGGDEGARGEARARAIAHAPFLARLAARYGDLTQAYVADGYAAAMALADALPDIAAPDFATRLRQVRAQQALLIALADLAGEHDLTTTVHALSDFADAACDAALARAFAERAEGAEVAGFSIIALGKLGSKELNYSSDIDPILIFDPEVMPRRARDDPGEAAVRIARRFVELLSERTADGHVLRVDLRLRPSPEVTPIVLPVEAAISYYESQALAWEQAAFVRSRASGGDPQLGSYFLQSIQPFIWRRSMDFGQIRRIADISERIRSSYSAGQGFGPGFDLKRGRGGIREVEFFTQVQQLIHGGRNPDLRATDTREALHALAAAGHIAGDLAVQLSDNLVLLRTIEHRVQMVEDQQEHHLPKDAAALDNLASLHGAGDGAALLDLLAPVTRRIAENFDQLIGTEQSARWPFGDGASASAAVDAGFADGSAAAATIAAWRQGALRVLRSAAAQEALEAILPALMAALGRGGAGDALLRQFDRMLAGLPSAINFFHLLAARPPLLTTLVAILRHAPTLANDLALRASLIEGLIDASIFADPLDHGEWRAGVARGPAADVELMLDHVRLAVGERRFALGVQLVEGVHDPLHIARGYADVAEVAVSSLTGAVVADFELQHGRIADGELLILALGRLGGRALTHASDLDLILLFTGELLHESDGVRPLGASRYFNRLGQRVIAALSVQSAAGRLYEVDTRLRPQGTQGPLVASLDAFARYQREDAWTWEHMALTRARPVYGSAAGRAAVQGAIDAALRQPRDAGQTLADIQKMRADMAQHKPPKGALDVKLLPGGLVDAEFAIHSQQLRHGVALRPELDLALTDLIVAGLAPTEVADSFALLSRLLVTMRLMAPDAEVPKDGESRARIATACRAGDWDDLMQQFADARTAISQWWRAVQQQG